jgi:hypothetical protein
VVSFSIGPCDASRFAACCRSGCRLTSGGSLVGQG